MPSCRVAAAGIVYQRNVPPVGSISLEQGETSCRGTAARSSQEANAAGFVSTGRGSSENISLDGFEGW